MNFAKGVPVSSSQQYSIATSFDNSSNWTIILGDSIEKLSEVPDDSVDLVVTSPPYFVGKEYDTSKDLQDFQSLIQRVTSVLASKIKPSGSICWEVGYHVDGNQISPLDYYIHNVMVKYPEFNLQNRIIWSFGHGYHPKRRFSGRHETVMWYTRGTDYYFDLDSVRVPQKYPGKTHYKGGKKGEPSGNPKGKNPSNVWDIPAVKAAHVEKTTHPCQFPVALVQRLIRALCPSDGLLLDPFAGVGSAGVAAIVEGRRFLGVEINQKYHSTAVSRCQAALAGDIRIRDVDRPVYVPRLGSRLTLNPFLEMKK